VVHPSHPIFSEIILNLLVFYILFANPAKSTKINDGGLTPFGRNWEAVRPSGSDQTF